MKNKMSFFIPKSIIIGSKSFIIIQNKKRNDAEFWWGKGKLILGTKNLNKDFGVFFNILCHELFEMWAVALNLRYIRPDTYESYEFHFNHKDFDNLTQMVSKTLLEFFKYES